jgi:hypothetical protein
MSHVAGHNEAKERWQKTEHWKYPETVGNDTRLDDISFNSHAASEYATGRLHAVARTASEPFILFEFMKIDESASVVKHKTQWGAVTDLSGYNFTKDLAFSGETRDKATDENRNALMKQRNAATESIKSFIKNLTGQAKRDYTGSIAIYMPTDIQINDTMGYNEDTRKIGALLEGWVNNDTELVNLTTMTDPAVLALAGAALGAIPIIPAAIAGVLGGSIGSLASTEVQKATGKIMNPNELLRYQNTALRSFSFNWTILPDSEDESKQAAGLIKFFRKSAHANRTSATLVTVPDHVVTSFHGGGNHEVGMIQLPPCYIESVNVTYNPNNSSFFKQNNAPVEIGLAVTLKEIVPIYADDVERGY